MDTMLRLRDLDRARYFADRLERYISKESLPWAEFFITRTRLLADWYEHPEEAEKREKVMELVKYAEGLGLEYPISKIKRELSES